jgi:hypothetical protein
MTLEFKSWKKLTVSSPRTASKATSSSVSSINATMALNTCDAYWSSPFPGTCERGNQFWYFLEHFQNFEISHYKQQIPAVIMMNRFAGAGFFQSWTKTPKFKRSSANPGGYRS